MRPAYPYRGDAVTLATSVGFATVRGRPPWANAVGILAPSSTIELITVAFTPRIYHLYFYDASGTRNVNRWNDLTAALTDRNTATNSSNFLGAMQTGDRLYIACERQMRGVAVDVSTVNAAGTATMVGEYPILSTGAWTDLSATDGTRSTRTLDQDGLITFTVPTAGWRKGTLREVTRLVVDGDDAPETKSYYWLRLRPDANLTTDPIVVDEITALLNATVAGVTPDNEGFSQVRVASGNKNEDLFELPPDVGGVELVSTSIASVCAVNWYNIPQPQAR